MLHALKLYIVYLKNYLKVDENPNLKYNFGRHMDLSFHLLSIVYTFPKKKNRNKERTEMILLNLQIYTAAAF